MASMAEPLGCRIVYRTCSVGHFNNDRTQFDSFVPPTGGLQHSTQR